MSPRNRTRKPVTRQRVAVVASRSAPGHTMSAPNQPFVGTERLTSVTGGGAGTFFTKTFHYNPGLIDTFSVGHFQAKNYDKYLMSGRNAVRYTPSCATTTSGSVYILIDYDPTDRAPSTELEFADNELTVTCASWDKMSVPIQASRMDNCRKLIRTGPSVESKLLTDACAIHVGAYGYGDTDGIGHVHIDYSSKLFVRQPLASGLRQPTNTLTAALGQVPIPPGFNSLTAIFTRFNTLSATVEAGKIMLPPGAYEVGFRIGIELATRDSPVVISAELIRNGVRIDLSPVVYAHASPLTTGLSLISNANIVQIAEGDSLEILFHHDHESDVTLIADRSTLLAKLIG